MGWLDEIVGEMIKNIPDDVRVDRTFGFGDIRQVIALAEKAIVRQSEDARAALDARASKAAADPTHSWVKNPIFASAGRDILKADLTFPRIFRSSLFIAIYSHTEYLLLSWCESIPDQENVSQRLRRTERGESYPARYLRFLRDDVGFALGDFTTWPEWQAIDAYRRARNCLAHRGGVVDDEEEAKAIATLPHFVIDDSEFEVAEHVVRLDEGACEAATECAQAFIGRAIAIAERDPRWDGPKVFGSD
jgi:hypothetical protein